MRDVNHGLSPPTALPQCQPGVSAVRAFLVSVLGDYHIPDDAVPCYYGTRSKSGVKTAVQSSELHEERDSDDEPDGAEPELVETSDDESDVESVDEATGAAAEEVLIDAPRRYPALPAVTYARPGILGPEYPPYASV